VLQLNTEEWELLDADVKAYLVGFYHGVKELLGPFQSALLLISDGVTSGLSPAAPPRNSPDALIAHIYGSTMVTCCSKGSVYIKGTALKDQGTRNSTLVGNREALYR
jgi:hypothetical protein